MLKHDINHVVTTRCTDIKKAYLITFLLILTNIQQQQDEIKHDYGILLTLIFADNCDAHPVTSTTTSPTQVPVPYKPVYQGGYSDYKH
jgi:hypothetical protein